MDPIVLVGIIALISAILTSLIGGVFLLLRSLMVTRRNGSDRGKRVEEIASGALAVGDWDERLHSIAREEGERLTAEQARLMERQHKETVTALTTLGADMKHELAQMRDMLSTMNGHLVTMVGQGRNGGAN